ncbi:MAG TPA: class I SAM-dependent methyltransferase [Terriglobales bacterium]|nr:class I SAM-dependent methyltransferase [Terriglobales bacterium]
MADASPVRSSSKTALGVAALRAAHQLLDGEPKILRDPISERLLDADVLQRLQSNPARIHEPLTMGLRSHVVLRSRYAEDRLQQAALRGGRQFVILGAGFDTFAYRQPDWARNLRIYEVDHPATQAEKRERLKSAGIPIPENLEFVAIDFESVALQPGLQTSTLDFSQPTFFSCLGVLVYLTPEAANAVFQLAASFPAGSEIVFTFSTPPSSLSRDQAENQAALAELAAGMGERWQTHFDPEKLTRDLRALFSTVSFLNSEDAERTYFQGRSDGLHAPRRGGLCAAIVGNDVGNEVGTEAGNPQQK